MEANYFTSGRMGLFRSVFGPRDTVKIIPPFKDLNL